MKNNDLNKHKGEYLDYVARQKGIKISFLAKEAGYDRTSYYNHISQPNLPYKIIAKYGEILNYDFSPAYAKTLAVKSEEDPEIFNLEQMTEDRNKWRKKYFDMVEMFIQRFQKENH